MTEKHVLKELTRHFCERWSERVSNGIPPVKDAVKKIMSESVVVQTGREIRTDLGGVYRTLTIFWHPTLGIVIKLDGKTGKAVSVLSGSTRPVIRDSSAYQIKHKIVKIRREKKWQKTR